MVWVAAAFIISYNIIKATWGAGPNFGLFFNSFENKITIIDFASHLNFTRDFWQIFITKTNIHSVYSVENHLNATGSLGWINPDHALPFGYSPTMLIILGPLTLFSNLAGYYLITFLSLISMWWQTKPARCRFGLGLLSLCSPLAFSCFSLGQTAILTAAGLLLISERSPDNLSSIGVKQSILPGIVLWSLTAKPPLALTAGCILIGLRAWHPLLIGIILTIISTICIAPLLGPVWVADYLNLIQEYNRVDADPVFSWSLWPSHMANLRGILSADFGISDNLASSISSYVWLLSLVAISVVGTRKRIRKGYFWSAGILLYLLFCPHVSSTEEVQILLLIPLCISPESTKLCKIELFILVIVPLMVLASPATGPFFVNNRLPLFSAKLFLLLLIIYRNRTRTWSCNLDNN